MFRYKDKLLLLMLNSAARWAREHTPDHMQRMNGLEQSNTVNLLRCTRIPYTKDKCEGLHYCVSLSGEGFQRAPLLSYFSIHAVVPSPF